MKRLLIALLLVFTSSSLWARGNISGWVQRGGQTVITNGVVSTTKVQASYPGATVTVYRTGTSTLATIYSTSGGTAKSNPFTASSTAFFSFWTDDTGDDLTFSGAGITTPFTISAIVPATSAASLPFINMKDAPYSAPSDGTNAQTAFATAVAALPSGGLLIVPDGYTFTFTSTLTINKPITLQIGASTITGAVNPLINVTAAGAVVKGVSPIQSAVVQTADADGIVIGANNVTISGIDLKGNNGGLVVNVVAGTGSGINAGGNSNVTIDGCTIENWPNMGINTGGASSYWTITRNLIRLNINDGILVAAGTTNCKVIGNTIRDSGALGVDINGSKNEVVGNQIYNSGANHAQHTGIDNSGVYIVASASPAASASYNVIANNVIDSSWQAGVYLKPVTGQNCIGNVIANNTITNGGDVGADGIFLQGGVGVGGFVRATTIIGNNCSSNGRHGIYVDGSTATIQATLISGNVTNSNATDGIRYGGAALDQTVLSNNTSLYNSGAAVTRTGSDTNRTEVGRPIGNTNGYEVHSSGSTELRLTSTQAGSRDFMLFLDASGNLNVYDVAAAKTVITFNQSQLVTAAAVNLGFYGHAATVQQTLTTGTGLTVDNVITALQTLGLVKN